MSDYSDQPERAYLKVNHMENRWLNVLTRENPTPEESHDLMHVAADMHVPARVEVEWGEGGGSSE